MHLSNICSRSISIKWRINSSKAKTKEKADKLDGAKVGSVDEGIGNRKVQELIGHDFEDYLTKTIGGEGSFSKGGRDFDGGIGNRWWEAKSGGYWDLIMNNPKNLSCLNHQWEID